MSVPPLQCSNPGVRTIEEELRVAFHKAGLVSDDNAENLNKVWCLHWALLCIGRVGTKCTSSDGAMCMVQWSLGVQVFVKAYIEHPCGQLDRLYDNDGKVKTTH
jgi:hypothetical protein